MSIETETLRVLLGKWQAETVEDLAPTSSLIWVGERQGIQRCAMQLEKVIEKIENDGRAAPTTISDMDPYNTSADRPK